MEPRFVAFVVRQDSPVKMIDLGSADSIAHAIEDWRTQFGAHRVSLERAENAAGELRKLVWLPIEQELGGCKHVVLSTDGVLGQVSFASLPGNEPGSYLLEEYSFAHVPVPRLLPELMKDTANQDRARSDLLLVGGVDYDAEFGDNSAASSTNPEQKNGSFEKPKGRTWNHLPATSDEIASVEAMYRDLFNVETDALKSLTGAHASEAQLRKLAPEYKILHLATHGFFAETQNASDSSFDKIAARRGLVLTDSDSPSPLASSQPGLLSGLVLAGANHPISDDNEDDGIMTATEVSFLPLERVDLVTLSACETGLGKVAGDEGLIGIQRAFQVAGARSVISTLWKVDDVVTRKLMERFYRNYFERRMSKLVALREAQL